MILSSYANALAGSMSSIFTSNVIKVNAPQKIENFLLKNHFSEKNIFMQNSFIKIHGHVNNKKVNIILDTGSRGISVDSNIPKIFGLKLIKTDQTIMNSDGKISPVYMVILPNITISGVKLTHVKATVLDLNWDSTLPNIVVGRNFMNKNHFIIDLKNFKLFLYPSKLSYDLKRKTIQFLMRNNYYSIPLIKNSTDELLIPVQIDNHVPAKFLFDTGTGITLLNKDYAKIVGIIRPNYNKKSVTIAKLIVNPLDTSFKSPILITNSTAQINNLSSLNKALKVQGIFGLAQMIKKNMLIAPFIDTVYVNLSKNKL